MSLTAFLALPHKLHYQKRAFDRTCSADAGAIAGHVKVNTPTMMRLARVLTRTWPVIFALGLLEPPRRRRGAGIAQCVFWMVSPPLFGRAPPPALGGMRGAGAEAHRLVCGGAKSEKSRHWKSSSPRSTWWWSPSDSRSHMSPGLALHASEGAGIEARPWRGR